MLYDFIVTTHFPTKYSEGKASAGKASKIREVHIPMYDMQFRITILRPEPWLHSWGCFSCVIFRQRLCVAAYLYG